MTDYFVDSGVISTGLALAGDELYVLSGGAVQHITTRVSGFEYVNEGGTATGTVVSSGGYENIRSGGLGTGTVVSEGGYEWVDGLAIGVTLNSGAVGVVRSGGVASLTTVNRGATELVWSGGVASDTLIEGGTLDLLPGGVASGSISFGTAASGTLIIEDARPPALTINGFAAGDKIILQAFSSDDDLEFDPLNHQVTISGSLGAMTLQFAASDGLNLTAVPDDTGGIDIVAACYLRGTMILTATGEVPVEQLAIGDRVITVRGHTRPIRWIGRRGYAGQLATKNPGVLPICVKANAIEKGVPARDLWVSPEHSLYIDRVLVQAKHLVNGVSVVQVGSVGDTLEYFHIELDDHDVIHASGAPAETYVDCDNRLMFANATEYARLYPDDDRPRWRFFAPRLEWGAPDLIAMRQRLFSRLEAAAPQPDPALHMIVNSTAIAPTEVNGTMYRFDIEAGATALWLASGSFVPSQRAPGSVDTRRLGVAVERIMLSDANLSIEAWHGLPALSEGVYDDEKTHRWTNGLARVPDVLIRPFPGGFTLDIYLAESDPAEQPARSLPGR